MCMVCTEFSKGRMTTAEAIRALGETLRTLGNTGGDDEKREHVSEAAEMILGVSNETDQG